MVIAGLQEYAYYPGGASVVIKTHDGPKYNVSLHHYTPYLGTITVFPRKRVKYRILSFDILVSIVPGFEISIYISYIHTRFLPSIPGHPRIFHADAERNMLRTSNRSRSTSCRSDRSSRSDISSTVDHPYPYLPLWELVRDLITMVHIQPRRTCFHI